MSAVSFPHADDDLQAVTAISCSEPDQGKLTYRGYNILSLVEHSSYEEVVYLLLHGRLPDIDELAAFLDDLTKNRELPAELLDMIRRIPPQASLMDVLHTAVAFLGAVDPDTTRHSRGALLRKAARTIAKLPTILAARCRLMQHQEPIHPVSQFTCAQNLLYMLSGYGPDEDAVHILDTILILYAEHESDVSSFVARVTASSFADYHSAIAAAISSLQGRLDRGGHEQTTRMLQRIPGRAGAETCEKNSFAGQRGVLEGGCGLYEHSDARSRIMKSLSRLLAEKTGDTRWHDRCGELEQIMLQEMGLDRNINPYTASVLHMLGFPTDLSTPLFTVARTVGWSAHVIEQLEGNKKIVPTFIYQGPKDLTYVPLRLRGGCEKQTVT